MPNSQHEQLITQFQLLQTNRNYLKNGINLVFIRYSPCIFKVHIKFKYKDLFFLKILIRSFY